MKCNLASIGFFLLVALTVTGSAQVLDCNSKIVSEKVICETFSLKTLEKDVHKQYNSQLKNIKINAEDLKTDQARWLEFRNSNMHCGNGQFLLDLPKSRQISCLKDLYERRLQELTQAEVQYVDKVQEENDSYLIRIKKSKYPSRYDFKYPEFKNFVGAKVINKWLEPEFPDAKKERTFIAEVLSLRNGIVSIDIAKSLSAVTMAHPSAPSIENRIYDLTKGTKLQLTEKDLDPKKIEELRQKVFDPKTCEQMVQALNKEIACPIKDCDDECVAGVCHEIEDRKSTGVPFDLVFVLNYPETQVGPSINYGSAESHCHRHQMIKIKTTELVSYFIKGSKSEKTLQQFVK